MLLSRLALAALLALGQPVLAQTPATDPASAVPADRVSEVMRLADLFQVLREEGIAYGADLQAAGQSGRPKSRGSTTPNACNLPLQRRFRPSCLLSPKPRRQ